MKCLIHSWSEHEPELNHWLKKELNGHSQADDLLQETFIKAMKHQELFCRLDNPRSWLFRVARNTLIDYHRAFRLYHPLDDQVVEIRPESSPVTAMQGCLQRALPEIDPVDRDIIEQCDLNGVAQAEYAHSNGVPLTTVKSRLRRARIRLKAHISDACQVRFENQCVADFKPRKK